MGAEAFVPERPSLSKLREAAAGCRGCDLWREATQTVFSEGSSRARLMLVGEMPGDPYVTNVVKHFKFEERGKRRIHQTPRKGEIDACTPWLDTEIKLIRPAALVTLGATAAKALLGSGFRLTQHRGELVESELAPIVAATIHPSAIVRQRDDASRNHERAALADDLRLV